MGSPGIRLQDGDQHTGYLLGSALGINTWKEGKETRLGWGRSWAASLNEAFSWCPGEQWNWDSSSELLYLMQGGQAFITPALFRHWMWASPVALWVKKFFFQPRQALKGAENWELLVGGTPSSCGTSSSFLKEDLGSTSQCLPQLCTISSKDTNVSR